MTGETADPRLKLGSAEVTEICNLLTHAARLLSHDQADARGQDGVCCHQQHQTGHWKDSQLVAGWLDDLAASFTRRQLAAAVPHPDTTPEDETDELF